MNVTTSRTTRSPYRSQKSFIAPLASGKTHTQHAHHIPRSRSPFKPFCRTAPTRRTTWQRRQPQPVDTPGQESISDAPAPRATACPLSLHLPIRQFALPCAACQVRLRR